MVKNFTLYYLLDDTNQTSDILFSSSTYKTLYDEQVELLLGLIEYDPGTDLVKQVLLKAGVE